jgi:hypothetical protein
MCSVKIDLVLELRLGALPNCHFGLNIGLTTAGSGCAGSLTGVRGSEGPGVLGSDAPPGVLGSETAEGPEVVAWSLPSLNAGWCS